MEKPKGCYVSMPFGRKPDPDGRVVDYDRIYAELIRPAVEHAGLTCFRADEFTGGAIILKSIFSAIMTSEVMVADVSSPNANVMYELGIRHATSARPTIVVAATDTRLPFNLTFTRTLRYQVGPDGVVASETVDHFRQSLIAAIEASLRAPAAFSPLFELFPELQTRVAQEPGSTPLPPAPPTQDADPIARRATRHTSLRAAEEQATQQPAVDPTAMLTIVKGYQEVGAWDDLVRFADTLPQELRENPDITWRVALALNRRARPGDRERAVDMMTRLIDRGGADAETYGILGRIYKDQFRESGDAEVWQKAYAAYRTGFEVEPGNYYPGLNAITLLVERGTADARRDLKQLLPRVKEALNQRIESRPADYWDLATGMHLAVIGREWSEAKTWAGKVLESSPSSWMLASTLNDLRALSPVLAETDRTKLARLLQPLETKLTAGNA